VTRRRVRIALVAAVVVLLVVLVTFTWTLFIRPATNGPAKVDAIIVLGGSGDRLQKGIALAEEGYAPYLVISSNGMFPCPSGPPHVQTFCFIPMPPTTQGEARAAAQLAAVHHWKRVIVVSSVPQTTRARIRFDRCYQGVVLYDPASPGGTGEWIDNVVYEWGALVKALVFQRAC
jgi:uncharacterized SAM-binding protein YcdF (DUF218 family)